MGEPTPPAETWLDPDEVQIGTSNGVGIYVAPPLTPMPANVTDDWTGWEGLGYLSDDGPTVGTSIDTENITPWQSVLPIRSVITARGLTIQMVMWQLNARTLAMYFDQDVPTVGTGGDLSFDIRSDAPQHLYSIGIDARDAEQVFRIAFDRASLTDAGDMQIQRGAAVPLDVTLSALDNAGILGHVQLGRLPTPLAAGASQMYAVRTPRPPSRSSARQRAETTTS